jgi:glycerol-3-phosphate cytidylyltransferase
MAFGTFDLLNVGHINFLNKAKTYGNKLIVGVAADNLVNHKHLIYKENDRLLVISSLESVDDSFLEDGIKKRSELVKQFAVDVVVLSETEKTKWNHLEPIVKVIYLPRIPSELVKHKIEVCNK